MSTTTDLKLKERVRIIGEEGNEVYTIGGFYFAESSHNKVEEFYLQKSDGSFLDVNKTYSVFELEKVKG